MRNTTTGGQVPSSFPAFRHRSAGFILSGFAISTLVVSGLFWIMYQLISIVQVEAPPPSKPIGLDFVDLNPKPVEPPKKTRKPEPPPVYHQPKPMTPASWKSGSGVPTFVFKEPDDSTLFGPGTRTVAGITDREYMPLNENQPIYPEKALVRGIEGHCDVTYDITRSGSVENVRVIPGSCSSSLFHSSSVKAATKFKYAPRIVDGQTVEALNVSKRFRFSISD